MKEDKIKFVENKQYEICSSFLRSLSAFVDYIIIFLIFFILSLFFKNMIYGIIDVKVNSLIGNNVNDLNNYSSDINTSGFISEIKQSIGVFLSEFKTFIYVLFVMYISFWGMVVSFLFIGETPGSKIFKLKLFDIDVRTREADFSQRFIRLIIYIADFFFLFGIGTLYSLFNKEKRGVAEILSGTIAMRKKTLN